MFFFFKFIVHCVFLVEWTEWCFIPKLHPSNFRFAACSHSKFSSKFQSTALFCSNQALIFCSEFQSEALFYSKYQLKAHFLFKITIKSLFFCSKLLSKAYFLFEILIKSSFLFRIPIRS